MRKLSNDLLVGMVDSQQHSGSDQITSTDLPCDG